jgi:uncharacterized protein
VRSVPYPGRHRDRRGVSTEFLSAGPDGVIVEVWVVPGASRESVGGIHDGALRVRTTAPAEAGRANRAVSRLVADHLGARTARVVAGQTARRKRILVPGVSLAEASRKCSDAAPPD